MDLDWSDGPDAGAVERFRALAEGACSRLHGIGEPDDEGAQRAFLMASRAAGYLEALTIVAPEVARSVSSDAERIAEALASASARLDRRLSHPLTPSPW